MQINPKEKITDSKPSCFFNRMHDGDWYFALNKVQFILLQEKKGRTPGTLGEALRYLVATTTNFEKASLCYASNKIAKRKAMLGSLKQGAVFCTRLLLWHHKQQLHLHKSLTAETRIPSVSDSHRFTDPPPPNIFQFNQNFICCNFTKSKHNFKC